MRKEVLLGLDMLRPMIEIIRRHVLQNGGRALLSVVAGGRRAWSQPLKQLSSFSTGSQATSPAWFKPVPASSSGITWKHSNGRSPDYYLPKQRGLVAPFSIMATTAGWISPGKRRTCKERD